MKFFNESILYMGSSIVVVNEGFKVNCNAEKAIYRTSHIFKVLICKHDYVVVFHFDNAAFDFKKAHFPVCILNFCASWT